MKSKHILVMVGTVAIGLLSPSAKADEVNSYFCTVPTPVTNVVTSSSVLIQNDNATTTTTTTTTAPALIDKVITSPVVVEKAATPPVMVEDRIVKRKHLFAIGIWPLFDIELR